MEREESVAASLLRNGRIKDVAQILQEDKDLRVCFYPDRGDVEEDQARWCLF